MNLTETRADDVKIPMTDRPNLPQHPAVVIDSGRAMPVAVGAPPAIVAHGLDQGALSARAVTFQGTAHASFDQPRQDSFALAASADWLVGVVSDGIGSCPDSHYGSAAAAHAVAAALAVDGHDPEDGDTLLLVAAEACLSAAAELGVAADAVSATLSVVIVSVRPAPDGSRWVLAHCAGDSPVLRLDPDDGAWHYLTSPADGPGNVVHQYVPGRHADAAHFCCLLPPGAVLVVCSDGFSIPLGDGTGPLGQDLAERWSAGPRELLPFVVDLSFDSYHDDKTVVAIWASNP